MKTAEELEKERLDELKKSEKELLERMGNEVQGEEEDKEVGRKNKKKSNANTPNLRKAPLNHYSVDDMEFDEPEYLQEMVRNDIKQKRLDEAKQDYDASKKEQKQEEVEEEVEEDYEDLSETNTDTQSIADSLSSLIVKEGEGSEFANEKWISQFKIICAKLNKNSIDSEQFEKLINSIIQKLDPSKDEKNKQRLCLLAQYFIEFYQSLFKVTASKIDFGIIEILKSFIYELTFKYGNKSTKKDPSIYVELFKKILTNINNEYTSLKVSEKRFPDLSIVRKKFFF